MTNKVVLRSIDEFMADYQPIYQPIYPLFLGKSQAYSEEVGKMNFKRLEAVGDIRTKHITPKDTDIRQISVKDVSKTFKKYFLANQFVQSALQNQEQTEDVVAQVLDEHQKQFDDMLMLGDGTSGSDVYNNGLYWSADSNYTLESITHIDKDADPLIDMFTKVMGTITKADTVAGRKLILFYGTVVLTKFNGLFTATNKPFKAALKESLESNYSVAQIPAATTPSGASGWIVVNLDQTKLHYTTLPQLKDQGVNDEKMYSWFNFLMGSCMLEVLALNAVIRQPADDET